MTSMITLTKYMKLPNKAHILYFYENRDFYLENLMTYIKVGIERGHHLLIIDNFINCGEIKQKLMQSSTNEQCDLVHFIDNQSFYQFYNGFHIQNILDNFAEVLKPYLRNKITVRTWANVEWSFPSDMIDKLENYECQADTCVQNMELMSVCAYEASNVSASIQTAMMRSHEYLMTDKELVHSSLYRC